MQADERIFSCDDHIDLWALPPDLWQSRMPAGLRDGAPHVVDAGPMKLWKAGNKILGPSGLTQASYSAITRAGIEDDGLRASTPDLRLADESTAAHVTMRHLHGIARRRHRHVDSGSRYVRVGNRRKHRLDPQVGEVRPPEGELFEHRHGARQTHADLGALGVGQLFE